MFRFVYILYIFVYIFVYLSKLLPTFTDFGLKIWVCGPSWVQGAPNVLWIAVTHGLPPPSINREKFVLCVNGGKQKANCSEVWNSHHFIRKYIHHLKCYLNPCTENSLNTQPFLVYPGLCLSCYQTFSIYIFEKNWYNACFMSSSLHETGPLTKSGIMST